MPRDEDTARNWLYIRLTGALIESERVSAKLDAYRAEVLGEAAEAVAAHTGNPLDANAQMLRRMASGAAP